MEQVGSAYAAALVETAQAKGSLDAVHADVDTLQVRNCEERKKEKNFAAAAAFAAFLESLTAAEKGNARHMLSFLLLLFSWCTGGPRRSHLCSRED